MDTVGFITNLPHGLVDSFKATLEELHQADLLVHVRDISHPQADFQKKTVLRVMKEVGLPDEMLREKYIEVWNKVDLITEDQEEEFKKKVEWAAEQDEHPVILMSCTQGFNKSLFLKQVGEKSADLKGKQVYKLSYDSIEHNERVTWLRRNAQIQYFDDAIEVSDDGSVISL